MEKIRTYLRRGEEIRLPAAQAMEGLLRMLRFDPSLYAVFEIWDRETRGLIRNCEAAGIQGTRLIVKVPSAAHRQEILYIKDRLLNRVNQALGRRMITDIQFELAPHKDGGQAGPATIRMGADASRVNADKGGTIRVQEQTRTGFERRGKR